jgi:hypothetical protein
VCLNLKLMSIEDRENNTVSIYSRTYRSHQLWTNITAVTLHKNMLIYGFYFNQKRQK